MSVARTELEFTLHRLANHVECQLADLLHELVVASRMEAVQDVAFSGSRFVEVLRDVRDGKEGGEG